MGMPSSRHCCLPGQPIPPNTLEWDPWLGPAPRAPYHPNRRAPGCNVDGKGFRSWYDYSGGVGSPVGDAMRNEKSKSSEAIARRLRGSEDKTVRERVESVWPEWNKEKGS